MSKSQANLLSSNIPGKPGKHAPCLDIDIPHKYVPSSTEGHGHIYFDVEVDEEKYYRLLDVMAECGIIESGYVAASKRKGGTYLRPEGVVKPVRPATREPELATTAPF